jgi:hypothetical protein
MSINVCGILGLTKTKLSPTERKLLCFSIVEKAIQNAFYISLGIEIFSGFTKKFANLPGKILFELNDDPMDPNAECLFMGEGITSPSPGNICEESLAKRMSRVQNFLVELLQSDLIHQITLNINFIDMGEDDFEIIEINVEDFAKTMLALYEKNENWTPVVRIIVSKPKELS